MSPSIFHETLGPAKIKLWQRKAYTKNNSFFFFHNFFSFTHIIFSFLRTFFFFWQQKTHMKQASKHGYMCPCDEILLILGFMG